MVNNSPPSRTNGGLQPERTSLAWVRTLLGYTGLLIITLHYSWQYAGHFFWMAFALLVIVAAGICRYIHRRNLIDVAINDVISKSAMQAKLLIALGVCCLALLCAVVHLRELVVLS